MLSYLSYCGISSCFGWKDNEVAVDELLVRDSVCSASVENTPYVSRNVRWRVLRESRQRYTQVVSAHGYCTCTSLPCSATCCVLELEVGSI